MLVYSRTQFIQKFYKYLVVVPVVMIPVVMMPCSGAYL